MSSVDESGESSSIGKEINLGNINIVFSGIKRCMEILLIRSEKKKPNEIMINRVHEKLSGDLFQ